MSSVLRGRVGGVGLLRGMRWLMGGSRGLLGLRRAEEET